MASIGRAESGRIILTRIGFPLLLSISLLSGCLSHVIKEEHFRPEQTHLVTDRVELPATFQDNFVVVEATLNGTGPYRLMLDTGASNLIVSPTVQQRAKLARQRFTRGHITVVGGSRTMNVNLARVDILEAGGLRLEGAKALVTEAAQWEVLSQSVLKAVNLEQIDGILGMSALYHLILEIDFPGRKVVLHSRERAGFPADRAAICEYVNHVPHVLVQLGQQEIRMMVDTGFNGSFHFNNLDDLPLSYPPQKFDGLAPYGAGGREPRGADSQIDGDLRLGPVRWRNAEVGTSPGSPSIGTSALNSWRLAFDQPADKIYFLGNHDTRITEKHSPTDPRYKAGMLGEIQGSFIRLVEVDSGGSFDRAGLQVGDLITAFDGVLPLEWLRRRARGEIPLLPRVKLSVLRNATKLETTVVQSAEDVTNGVSL